LLLLHYLSLIALTIALSTILMMRTLALLLNAVQHQTVLSDEAAAHSGGYTAVAQLQEGAVAFKAFVAQLAAATATATAAADKAVVAHATPPECALPTTHHSSNSETLGTCDDATALLIR
jgi:hypothetical protein